MSVFRAGACLTSRVCRDIFVRQSPSDRVGRVGRVGPPPTCDVCLTSRTLSGRPWSRHTSRAARRVEYHCLRAWRPGVEESRRRHVEPRPKRGSLLSHSVGATRRLVATTLQSKSVRVAPTLTPPEPGSSLRWEGQKRPSHGVARDSSQLGGPGASFGQG